MVDLVAVTLVAGGAVLLFFGAVLSVYGVGLLGAAVGGGIAYLLGPTSLPGVGIEGSAATAAAVPVGALVGVIGTYMLLSLVISAIGFVIGGYIGMVAVAPALGETGLVVYGIGVAVGVGTGVLASFLSKTTMVVVTSFVGATLVSQTITADEFVTAKENLSPEPLLFDPVTPLVLGLFALGVLSQFGLFKLSYVTGLIARLPGARRLRDRGENQQS
jgi:hypothetical protein